MSDTSPITDEEVKKIISDNLEVSEQDAFRNISNEIVTKTNAATGAPRDKILKALLVMMDLLREGQEFAELRERQQALYDASPQYAHEARATMARLRSAFNTRLDELDGSDEIPEPGVEDLDLDARYGGRRRKSSKKSKKSRKHHRKSHRK